YHPIATDGPLTTRDPFGTFSTTTSEHFAFKFGPDKSVDATTAQTVLSGLERVWQFQISQRKFPPPRGTDRYQLNVYLGNSGDGGMGGAGISRLLWRKLHRRLRDFAPGFARSCRISVARNAHRVPPLRRQLVHALPHRPGRRLDGHL